MRSRIEKLLAEMLSPYGLLTRACVLACLFILCHLAGLREHASVLCGTRPPAGTETVQTLLTMLGCVYVVTYFLLVLVVPILTLAGLLMWVATEAPRTRRRSVER
jgi:hypothetical protein